MLPGSPDPAGTFLGLGRWRSCHSWAGWEARNVRPMEQSPGEGREVWWAAAAGETWQKKLLGAV